MRSKQNGEMLTTFEAAKIIGVARQRVSQLISSGVLSAEWSIEGHKWKIKKSDAIAYRDDRGMRQVGRPAQQ